MHIKATVTKFNVLFVVNSTKKLKDGSLPVYVRVTIDYQRIISSTGIFVET